jgi:hypothetical protein
MHSEHKVICVVGVCVAIVWSVIMYAVYCDNVIQANKDIAKMAMEKGLQQKIVEIDGKKQVIWEK